MKTHKLNQLLQSLILANALLLSVIGFAQQQELLQSVQKEVKFRLENDSATTDEYVLYTTGRMRNFYKDHNYKLMWFNKSNRKELIRILEDAYNEGLNPADYHLDHIKNLEQQVEGGNQQTELLASLELLMSDATVLYASHLIWGKVDQSKIRKGWDINQNPEPEGIDALFEQYKYNENLPAFFESLKPGHFMYIELRKGLKRYREIAQNGGWPTIPEGQTLKKGMTDPRVAIVRNYFKVTGDLPGSTTAENPGLFDEELEKAVKAFQFRHNLTQDGAIGKGTLGQMNVPVEKRIDMIRINMERARWVMHQLPSDFLVVNIAGFNVRRLQDGKIIYYSNVIVGKRFHESPIFKGKMTYIEINPTWTLPYSIATKETLPKLKNNPNYLAEKHMVIMDRSGKILDPSTIDFSQYSTRRFPFTIRQEPGPNNALGQVKFMFPNKYSVYLHDTPARSLFSREARAFSHGCIRLEKKWELLMSLMNQPEVWNMDKINEILKSGKTTRINLPNPIDILILYWTAGADTEDRLFFNKDVYNRDEVVLKALNAPLSL